VMEPRRVPALWVGKRRLEKLERVGSPGDRGAQTAGGNALQMSGGVSLKASSSTSWTL